MNKILKELDADLQQTQAALDLLKFNPIMNPCADLDALIDDYFSYNAQRLFMQDRITALQAIRPILITAIEAAEQEQAQKEREAQRARDAARVKELMAELATMDPGPEYSLVLMEISKLRGE